MNGRWTGKYFEEYSPEEQLALWNEFVPLWDKLHGSDDKIYEVVKENLASNYPDYMNMTEFHGIPFDPNNRSHVAVADMLGWKDYYWDVPFEEYYKSKQFEDDIEDEADDSVTKSSIQNLIKSKTDAAWENKGLPNGFDKTLPAYYRTVKMGMGKDAIDVHSHRKMPMGEGIDVKTISKSKGADDMSFREKMVRKSFEKTGVVADVEFMTDYNIKKAKDEESEKAPKEKPESKSGGAPKNDGKSKGSSKKVSKPAPTPEVDEDEMLSTAVDTHFGERGSLFGDRGMENARGLVDFLSRRGVSPIDVRNRVRQLLESRYVDENTKDPMFMEEDDGHSKEDVWWAIDDIIDGIYSYGSLLLKSARARGQTGLISASDTAKMFAHIMKSYKGYHSPYVTDVQSGIAHVMKSYDLFASNPGANGIRKTASKDIVMDILRAQNTPSPKKVAKSEEGVPLTKAQVAEVVSIVKSAMDEKNTIAKRDVGDTTKDERKRVNNAIKGETGGPIDIDWRDNFDFISEDGAVDDIHAMADSIYDALMNNEVDPARTRDIVQRTMEAFHEGMDEDTKTMLLSNFMDRYDARLNDPDMPFLARSNPWYNQEPGFKV